MSERKRKRVADLGDQTALPNEGVENIGTELLHVVDSGRSATCISLLDKGQAWKP
jgi:hypothetical protein